MGIRDWRITDGFGAVDQWHPHGHKGVDFAVPADSPFPSVGDGYVTRVADDGMRSFGRSITVRMRDGYDVIYGHLSRQTVRVGDPVRTGQVIGYTGNTGDSTGPHLHLQVMRGQLPIDPLRYLGENAAPWWDANAHGMAMMDGFKDWWESALLDLATGTLEWALPALAAAGVLWWMTPFAPRHERGLKLAGFVLVLYLFYRLMRGVYLDG